MHLHRRIVALLISLVLVSGVLAQQRRPIPKPPEGTKVLKDLAYVTEGHERQKLDIYIPKDAKGKLPLVVWVHGGSWRGGNKNRHPGMFLLERGYVIASINYRLSQHAVFPAQIEDCRAAIRWLKANAANYHIDPNRVGVWGASAGGHLVALLGVAGDFKEFDVGDNLDQSASVQAVCNWFGPTDLRGIAGGERSPVTRLLGGTAREKEELAAKASPVTFVTNDDPPFLIQHGDSDRVVPLRHGRILTEALEKANVEVTLKVYEGAGHGGAVFLDEAARKLIAEFFDRHLRDG